MALLVGSALLIGMLLARRHVALKDWARRDTHLTSLAEYHQHGLGPLPGDTVASNLYLDLMKRAVETAELIAEQIGYDTSHIVRRDEFVERFMGYYSGKPHEEYRQANLSDNTHESLETTESMLDRVSSGLEWLKDHTAQNIVIVAHGGIGRAVKAYDQKFHHSKMYRLDGMDNASIYELTL